MPKKLVITQQTDADLIDITNYLQSEWGNKVADDFLTDLTDFYKVVVLQPRAFAYYIKSKNIRKHTVKNINLVLYRITRTRIEIIAILDGRMNPQTIKKITRKRM